MCKPTHFFGASLIYTGISESRTGPFRILLGIADLPETAWVRSRLARTSQTEEKIGYLGRRVIWGPQGVAVGSCQDGELEQERREERLQGL